MFLSNGGEEENRGSNREKDSNSIGRIFEMRISSSSAAY
jgi:hypothetical protein